jgi:hypothetical protein
VSIEPGPNMEFARRVEPPFAVGVEMAAKIGYEFAEPLFHIGRELMSEAGYYHSAFLEEALHFVKDILDQHGLKVLGVQARSRL